MAKVKKAFFCQNCGTQHTQWQGQCKGCKEWNTLAEELMSKEPTKEWDSSATNATAKPIRMDAIDVSAVPRFHTGDDELNRVLGGGLVAGAVILLGGEPGIGKSTLLLQLALQLKKKVLRFLDQKHIKNKYHRIDKDSKNFGRLFVYFKH